MNILTINGNDKAIKFKIFRYSKKGNTTILAEGRLSGINTNSAKFVITNLLNKQTFKEDVKLSGGTYEEALKALTNYDKFNSYNFDVVINHIPHGGDEYSDIVLLHANTLKTLAKYNKLAFSHPEFASEPQSLLIAKHFMQLLPKVKHYACFDTAFHHQLFSKAAKTDAEKHYGSYGLAFQYISSRLPAIVESKIAKKNWIVVYWGNEIISICAIKNGKALINTFETKVVSDINNKPIKDTEASICTEIAGQIMRMATLAGGLSGIVFSGDVGVSNPAIRSKVLEKLEWLGFGISKKANSANKIKIHKKESLTKVLVVPADEEQAMIDQFIKRNS